MPADLRQDRLNARTRERGVEPTPTAGEVLVGGQLLELVRAPNCARPKLLVYDEGRITIDGMVQVNGRKYVPAEIEPSISHHLRFPTESKPHGSARDLFASITAVLRTHGGLTKEAADLTAYFVFATPFVDCLRISPCLLISGSALAEAVQLLRILSALCWRSLLLTGVTSDGLWNLPTGLRPTLLLHLPEQNLTVERLLQSSQLLGFRMLHKTGLRDVVCGKAIYLGRHNLRGLLTDGCIQVSIVPSCRRSVIWDDSTENGVAAEIQPRLLDYRLRNRDKIVNSQFDVVEFTGATRDLARSLGSCIVGDTELQAGIIPLLQAHDQSIRSDLSIQLEPVIVEALLVLCHEKSDRIYIGEVTELVNAILSGRGETVVLRARKVGAMLAALNLFTERDATGYAFRLLNGNRLRVHDLARAYQVPSLQDGVKRCQYCVASKS